ncbi:MAG: cupin domain-containing protein [Lachnospiraceae bacterium]|nr:cupin domain-containing protein [Lachnospiraceae bacterium]
MQEFITPPNHKGFSAKRLFDEGGKIKWGAIAYIDKDGGGPEGNHTHRENHIFIVVDGEARVMLDDKAVIVKKNESFFVNGMTPHSIWNNSEETTVVIKISTECESEENH